MTFHNIILLITFNSICAELREINHVDSCVKVDPVMFSQNLKSWLFFIRPTSKAPYTSGHEEDTNMNTCSTESDVIYVNIV